MIEQASLDIPFPAKSDSKAFEVLRVWIANNGQHVSIRTGVWKDPAAWGILLADLVRHIANSYEQVGDFSKQETLQRIKASLDTEIRSPTDNPTGHVPG